MSCFPDLRYLSESGKRKERFGLWETEKRNIQQLSHRLYQAAA